MTVAFGLDRLLVGGEGSCILEPLTAVGRYVARVVADTLEIHFARLFSHCRHFGDTLRDFHWLLGKDCEVRGRGELELPV